MDIFTKLRLQASVFDPIRGFLWYYPILGYIPIPSEYYIYLINLHLERFNMRQLIENNTYCKNQDKDSRTITADIFCKGCNNKIGKIAMKYPLCNPDDINLEIPNFCPNCEMMIFMED